MRRLPLVALCAWLPATLLAQRPAPVAGLWEGTVSSGGTAREIRLAFRSDSSGLAGTVDLPSQYALGYPLADVTVKDSVVLFAFGTPQLPPARFRLVRQGGGRLTGTFESPAGRDTLRGTVDVWRRPDARPPYRTEEVRFRNGAVELRGTLYLPAAPAPAPAVVFLHGSGPQTRESYLRSFADAYARRGFAALIYDKRNTGRSDVPLWQQGGGTFSELAGDAREAVRLVRGRPEVDSARVGVWGLSQGAWIAPLAARHPEVAFVTLVSGGGVTPAEQELYDDELRLREAGYGGATIDTALALLRVADAYVRSGADDDWARLQGGLATARARPWFALLDRFPLVLPREAPAWAGLRADLDYDPSAALGALRVPTLLVLGERDQLTPPEDTERRVRAATAPAASLTVLRVPGADHGLFVPARAARWIDRTPAAGVPGAMIAWAAAAVRPPAR